MEAGHDGSTIAWRLRKSPGQVRRIAELAELPRNPRIVSGDVLRPVERCVLRQRAAGTGYSEIAARMRRSAPHVQRVEVLARYKLRG